MCALAEGARMYHFTRPVVMKENVIEIKGGRLDSQEIILQAMG
jgi:hypothetical protein